MKELVSIITPCYNSANYIRETIESVLNQTYTNWEWFIVDDCSKDNSVEIIKQYKDSRIKLIEQKENGGAAIARNKALKYATGRFITFIDSDDLWMPFFLEKSINFLLENKETLVYSTYKRVDEKLKPKLKDFIAIDKVDFHRILLNNPIPMLTSIYDSKEIGKIEIPLVDKREDHAHWIMILKKIKHARAIKEPMGIYRIRENSYSRNKLEMLEKQYKLYKNYLKLPIYKSIFYSISWSIYGVIKYIR